MATDKTKERKLSDIYDEAYNLYEEIQNTGQPTNSGVVQHQIKTTVKLLEELTQLISIASLFSTNEHIDEISSNDLKFFLLPFHLGNLTLKISSTDRSNIVQTADIYFRDFIQRCNDYGIVDVEIPQALESTEDCEKTVSRPTNSPSLDLASAAKSRAAKIQRFNEQKALQAELKELRKRLNLDSTDDEVRRKYYLSLIKSAVSESLVELESLITEKSIIKYMENMKKEGKLEDIETKKKMPKPKPLVPVIITRDEVQKKIFGAGYPSIATMSVQDFYDQRVREGIFPDAATVQARCLQDLANKENAELIQNREEEERENKIENDDEDTLARARNMDEYKDVHKRGEGNRYNRS